MTEAQDVGPQGWLNDTTVWAAWDLQTEVPIVKEQEVVWPSWPWEASDVASSSSSGSAVAAEPSA